MTDKQMDTIKKLRAEVKKLKRIVYDLQFVNKVLIRDIKELKDKVTG